MLRRSHIDNNCVLHCAFCFLESDEARITMSKGNDFIILNKELDKIKNCLCMIRIK